MKILHIVPSYKPAYRYGGTIEVDHELNRWLVKNGNEVTVYTTNANGADNLNIPLNTKVDLDGVNVVYFPLGKFRSWFYSKEMRLAIKESIVNFDIVHITSVFLSASTLGAYYSKKFSKPYVMSPHGSLMKVPLEKSRIKKYLYLKLIESRNLAGASAIHFTVDKEKEEYISARLPFKKAIIIPNGIDPEKFAENPPRGNFRKKFNISADKKIILFLSRISWKKGFDILIPAVAEVLKKQDCVLAIAGGDDEGYKSKVQELIDEFKIGDKVIFAGMLMGDDKIWAYRDADVFVLPSLAENFALVVLEAMLMKLPVVVSPEVGVSGSVLKFDAGLVAQRNILDFSAAILKILDDAALATAMGERGREAVIKNFSWNKIAESFIKEYNSIINNE